jgi:hypothetical protein
MSDSSRSAKTFHFWHIARMHPCSHPAAAFPVSHWAEKRHRFLNIFSLSTVRAQVRTTTLTLPIYSPFTRSSASSPSLNQPESAKQNYKTPLRIVCVMR